MMTDNNLEITLLIELPVVPEKLWSFLINGDGIKQWLKAKTFIIDLEEGGQIDIPFSRGGRQYRIVGESGLLRHNQRFDFTWIERDDKGREWFTPTVITLLLTPTGNGTSFSIAHKGFKYLPAPGNQRIHAQYVEFWHDAAESLQRLISTINR
jgi:uncharacterized protein YndB with AHSA1/START domain